MNKREIRQFSWQFLLITIGLLSYTESFAQNISIKGVVSDPAGNPIIGATVTVQGTQAGTITNSDGEYQLLDVDDFAILEYAYLGFKNLQIPSNGRSEINVMLEEEQQELDKVVVVGYGSLSKRELSSSVVQIDKESFLKGSMNNVMELLTGRVAGLNVNNTAAANPNSTSNLQIRGATSITASNSPLIVIDGVAGGDIRNLSSQDIESMTVLKDAGSAAIYGTRGANGVILITTKRGSEQEGVTSVVYDSWFGVNLAKDGPEILTADEFRRSRRGTDYGSSTDWYSLMFRDFSYENNQYVAINSSTQNGFYSASFNYKDATGLDLVSDREEYGGRLVFEQKVLNNRLQIGGSLNARRVNETWGNDNMFDTALTLNPTMPLYDDNGEYYQPISPTGAINPVEELLDNTSNGQRLYILTAAEAKYNIISGDRHLLNTSINYSLHYNDLKSNYYTPSTSAESFWNGYDGRANVTYQKWQTQRVEWLVNYVFTSNGHNIKAVAGYTHEASSWEKLQASNSNFAYDNILWHDIGSGSYLGEGVASMSTGKSLSKLVGTFARVNYNWKDLLMGSASIRYEGSTKFGDNNKWGAFPSASLAWEISNMDFMSGAISIIKSLKPRVSYGVTGRSDFDSYLSLATYNTSGSYFIDGAWVSGYAPSINDNPDLAWERSICTNIGLDADFWNRLRISVDLFDRLKIYSTHIQHHNHLMSTPQSWLTWVLLVIVVLSFM
ncbi:MAG: SusC/RagA family TonB-linked outer membrane protein [Rikenellaceae bacterium]